MNVCVCMCVWCVLYYGQYKHGREGGRKMKERQRQREREREENILSQEYKRER